MRGTPSATPISLQFFKRSRKAGAKNFEMFALRAVYKKEKGGN